MHPERRANSRRPCCYPVDVRLGGEEVSGTVRDMGLGGMRLLMPRPVEPEAVLQVGQTRGGQVSVKVVWSCPRDGQYDVGVVYSEPPHRLDESWVKPALSQLGFEQIPPHERRRHVRVRLDVGAAVHHNGAVHPCTLLDLGLGGALVELERPELPDGGSVQLEVQLDVERLPSRVIYRQEQDGQWRYGICFDTDRNTQAVARLVEGYLRSMR